MPGMDGFELKARLGEDVRTPKMVPCQRDITLPRSLFPHTIFFCKCCSDSL